MRDLRPSTFLFALSSAVLASTVTLVLPLMGSPSRGKASTADHPCQAKVVTIYAPIEDVEREQNDEMMRILEKSDRDEAAGKAR